MIEAVFMMGGLGLVVGVGLAMASKVFYVYVDPLIVAVDEALPGANCGGCGLPGCSANAEAIVDGKATPNSCVAAGDDVAEAIAAILGVTIEAKEPDIAKPGCTYGLEDADVKFLYDGLGDCRAAALINGGMKVCQIGCLGLGTCASACPFDAIVMGPEGLPVVDEIKCTGCGTCERVCPKNIITLSSVTRRIIQEYTTDDCTTPCQRACPAGIDICEYIAQIEQENYDRALQVIKERNPFPSVIGRICPRPCEDVCRRQLIDEPVAINFLKRYVADYEQEMGERVQPYKAPDTGRSIAVVGGGVEGLSTAFFCARLGHAPTVFESSSKLGGILRQAIATNRLSMDTLDWDIAGIIEMGVNTQLEKSLGKDISIDSLLTDGFNAVFLALGGWDSRILRGAAVASIQPIPGLYLLIDIARGLPEEKAPGLSASKHTVLVGGGDLALETALKLKPNHAGQNTVLFRESADINEISDQLINQAKEAGIELVFGAAIARIMGEQNQLQSVEYIDLATGSAQNLKADTVAIASGRYPEMIFARPQPEESENQAASSPAETENATGWEGFFPSKNPYFGDQIGLLAHGDVLSDYSGAIRAIGGGRRAAASIHNVIYGIPLAHPTNVLTSASLIQNIDSVCHVQADPRTIMPMADPTTDIMNAELEKGFTETMAGKESARCLQCGLICYQKTGTDSV